MKSLKLAAVLFAAFTSVSAFAQIITNYGEATNPNWGGNFTGSSMAMTSSPWAAQTFVATSSGPIYAYNVQLTSGVATAPSFTTSIYEWNTGTNTLGAIVNQTTAFFTLAANSDYTDFGSNVITNPGMGTTALTAGNVYAIVIERTDGTTTGARVGSTSNADDGTAYTGGQAFRSANGTTWSVAPVDDLAFWVSFESDILSPTVPEPAVNGAILGALFVTGLFVWRRYAKKGAAAAPSVAA